MITVIDYGLGNVNAFLSIYKSVSVECISATTESDLKNPSGIILPGVGSFDHAMNLLNNSGMRKQLDHLIINKKVPVLGVCVGMQMFANSSEEGNSPGLGWINGKVKLIEASTSSVLPHMGWNNINYDYTNPLFMGCNDELNFYFLHSYFFDSLDDKYTIATVNYGTDFCCALNRENIFGVQFHPEKSHKAGIVLLKNFSEFCNQRVC